MDLEWKCKVKPNVGIHWKPEYSRRPSVYKVGQRAPLLFRTLHQWRPSAREMP